VSLLLSIVWSAAEADVILYSDVLAAGLGFFIPADHEGFFLDIPLSPTTVTIF
jgi:hypothetical protein